MSMYNLNACEENLRGRLSETGRDEKWVYDVNEAMRELHEEIWFSKPDKSLVLKVLKLFRQACTDIEKVPGSERVDYFSKVFKERRKSLRRYVQGKECIYPGLAKSA